jgi:type IV secretion system protein VirD4
VLEADPAHRTLLAAADLVLAPEAMETFEAWSRSGPEVCGGRLAKAAAAVLAMGDRQRGAVLSALAENLAWLSYDQVRAMLSPAQDDVALSFGDLLDDKVDLWILVPQDMVVAMGNMLRLVTTLALGSVTRQDGRRTVKAPILAVLDEFLRLGRMEKVLEIATIAAGGGITAIFVAQDKGSLDAVYGREGAGTIAGACATTRIFALGRADDITAAWAERQLPSKTVLRESRSHSTNGTPQVNRGEDRQRLLDAPDIQELPPSRILCLIRSQPPLLLDRIISHRHPAYRSRLDPNPVVRA